VPISKIIQSLRLYLVFQRKKSDRREKDCLRSQKKWLIVKIFLHASLKIKILFVWYDLTKKMVKS